MTKSPNDYVPTDKLASINIYAKKNALPNQTAWNPVKMR